MDFLQLLLFHCCLQAPGATAELELSLEMKPASGTKCQSKRPLHSHID